MFIASNTISSSVSPPAQTPPLPPGQFDDPAFHLDATITRFEADTDLVPFLPPLPTWNPPSLSPPDDPVTHPLPPSPLSLPPPPPPPPPPAREIQADEILSTPVPERAVAAAIIQPLPAETTDAAAAPERDTGHQPLLAETFYDQLMEHAHARISETSEHQLPVRLAGMCSVLNRMETEVTRLRAALAADGLHATLTHLRAALTADGLHATFRAWEAAGADPFDVISLLRRGRPATEEETIQGQMLYLLENKTGRVKTHLDAEFKRLSPDQQHDVLESIKKKPLKFEMCTQCQHERIKFNVLKTLALLHNTINANKPTLCYVCGIEEMIRRDPNFREKIARHRAASDGGARADRSIGVSLPPPSPLALGSDQGQEMRGPKRARPLSDDMNGEPPTKRSRDEIGDDT